MYNPPYNYRPNNNYAQRLNALEQQYYQQPQMPSQPQAQPIQTMASSQPQATCYFVNSPEDMNRINVMLDTVYLGINDNAKELYIRKMNNDGMIDFEVYKLASGTQEKDKYNLILEQLTAINEKLTTAKETRNESDVIRNNKQPGKPSDSRAF